MTIVTKKHSDLFSKNVHVNEKYTKYNKVRPPA